MLGSCPSPHEKLHLQNTTIFGRMPVTSTYVLLTIQHFCHPSSHIKLYLQYSYTYVVHHLMKSFTYKEQYSCQQ